MLDIYRKQAEALSHLSLEELLEMEKEFELKLEKETKEAERLEKRLMVVRQELREYREASKKLKIEFEQTPFYEHLVEFLEKNEEFLNTVKINNGELIAFLYALASKIKEMKKGKDMGRFKGE